MTLPGITEHTRPGCSRSASAGPKRPGPSRWRGLALAALAATAPALAGAGCSEGYDIPPLYGQPCLDESGRENHDLCAFGLKCYGGVCTPKGDADCTANEEPSQGDMCTQDCLTATCASSRGKRICTCSGGVFVQCACMPPDDWPYDDVPAVPYCDETPGLETGSIRYLADTACEPLNAQCLSRTSPGNGCLCHSRYVCGETTALNISASAPACDDTLADDPCPANAAQCVSPTTPTQGCTCPVTAWDCQAAGALGIPETAPICEDAYKDGNMGRIRNKPCDVPYQLCIARDYNPEGTSPRGCACGYTSTNEWYCGATNRWWRAE